MIVEASAPANIALIKYMGKTSSKENLPSNSSLSWTLDELRTFVRVTLKEDSQQDQWQMLTGNGFEPMQLSESGIQRYMSHFANLKSTWGIDKYFLVESANNFPADCGLASSASSFAALTKAAVEIFQKISSRPEIGMAEIAELSRKGSGSSCRSFFGPWVLWHKEGVRPMEFPMPHLLHQVVVIDDKKKQVSSSEAHKRVDSSYLFKGRPERAERRLAETIHALQTQDWRTLFDISWTEFWDMHSLFETSVPPFGYFEPESMLVLDAVKNLWKSKGDGPVVTMDAGANVHFLWRADQLTQAVQMTEQFSQKFRLFSCQQITENSKRH